MPSNCASAFTTLHINIFHQASTILWWVHCAYCVCVLYINYMEITLVQYWWEQMKQSHIGNPTKTHTGDLNVDVSSSLESLGGSSPNLSCEFSNVWLWFPESTPSASSEHMAASRFISSNICCSNDCDNSSSGFLYFAKLYGFSPYAPCT